MVISMLMIQIFPEFHDETDAIKYMEERNMTLSLLNAMVADDFDHLVNGERAEGNPATVYKIIKTHFFSLIPKFIIDCYNWTCIPFF